jgi:hypothetical protein
MLISNPLTKLKKITQKVRGRKLIYSTTKVSHHFFIDNFLCNGFGISIKFCVL